jgi:hypothetical protein
MRNIKIRNALLNLLIFVGCKETTDIILKPERRLRVFENRVLRRIFGPKRDEITGEWKNCVMISLMICTYHQILFG